MARKHGGGSPEYTREEVKDAVEAYVAAGGVIAEAARRVGMKPSTFKHRIDRARELNMMTGVQAKIDGNIALPEFPSDDVPIEEVIDLQRKRFEKRFASYDAHTWFRIEVKEDKAIGVDFHGDPHLDDNGVNWPVLLDNIEIHKRTPGMYGVNIGDSSNNWHGRLAQLYANQDTSVKTARRLVEWYMTKSEIRWLVWLLGNHDLWGDGAEVIAQMASKYGTQKLVCHDWEARFILAFPNGWEVKVYAAHDFRGHSQWNPLHGPMKEGAMGEEADIYVCGHKHNWAVFAYENPARRREQHFIRVRGFKFLDDYARRLGLLEQSGGCSALVVLDPERRAINTFTDIASGAKYLSTLRTE